MADTTTVPALPTISPDTTASAPELPPQPAPDPRELRLQALRAAHPGERMVLLSAGAGDNAVSFGVKLPSAAAWALIAADLQGNAAVAEETLRGAVVGATPEETVAERARLENILNEDPPLGDFWGMQILQLVGMGAKITTSPKPDAAGLYELRAALPGGGEVLALQCKKRSRPQWILLRDIAAKKGPQAFAAAAYDMLITSANKTDVAQRYPALVSALGDAAASAGSRSETGAPFGLPR